MSTLLRTPAHNPGLTTLHNSKALAGFSPLVFEWTRRDYDVVSVAENGGRSNQLDIVIATDITTEVSDGATLWLEANGFYSGELTTISSSYSAPNTTITTTALKNAAAVTEYDFINLISDRTNWRLSLSFKNVDETDGTTEDAISSASITPGPGPLFRMSIDAAPFINTQFDLTELPDWTTSTRQQRLTERGFLFFIGYSDLYDGASPTEDTTDTFLCLPAYKGARDRYGENAIDLAVWENSLADAYKPVLTNALPNPIYFRDYPFFAGFGMETTDAPTWQLVQNNNRGDVTPSTTSTNAFTAYAGQHLVSIQDPGHDDLEAIRIWLEAGVFWSFYTIFEYGVDIAFVPAVNATSGTHGNWLFEDGSETVSSIFPSPADITGLDGTLQEVKVTGITADEIIQFSAIAADAKIYGAISFQPCELLSSITMTGQSQITEIIGPDSDATNVTQIEIDTLAALTTINLSGIPIMSGNFSVADCTALTSITLPTVENTAFDLFAIKGCTSFVQKIPLGIKFPDLMNKTGSAIELQDNGWSATIVDYYLSQLDEACDYGYTGRTIDITGNTAPTVASLGAITSLTMKGVAVSTD